MRRRRPLSWLPVLAALIAVAAWRLEPAPSPDIAGGVPRSVDWHIDLATHVLRNPGFTIGYSEWHRAAVWVAYRARRPGDTRLAKRPDGFSIDRRTLFHVAGDDYRGSGFDRGHLAPNYLIGRLYGAQAQKATFLMSNVAPQAPRLNQLLWQRLEEAEADVVAPRAGEIWVIAGPVFGAQRLRSGVAVPRAFYRIWLDEQPLRALAFLVPQDVCGDEPLDRFVVSVDAVEEATGLDFFRELEDSIEQALESTAPAPDWKIATFNRLPARYADNFRGQDCKRSLAP